jgi:hypothetical protein
MTTTDNSSPLRDITGWATSEDLPPQDLFSSIEQYRTFVHRWRALYKEVSRQRRLFKTVWKYQHALWQIEYQTKYRNKLGHLVTPGIKPWRKAEAEKAQQFLDQPRSDEYKAYDASPLKPWQLLEQRAAGKRWVKHYYPWTSRTASAPQTHAAT